MSQNYNFNNSYYDKNNKNDYSQGDIDKGYKNYLSPDSKISNKEHYSSPYRSEVKYEEEIDRQNHQSPYEIDYYEAKKNSYKREQEFRDNYSPSQPEENFKNKRVDFLERQEIIRNEIERENKNYLRNKNIEDLQRKSDEKRFREGFRRENNEKANSDNEESLEKSLQARELEESRREMTRSSQKERRKSSGFEKKKSENKKNNHRRENNETKNKRNDTFPQARVPVRSISLKKKEAAYTKPTFCYQVKTMENMPYTFLDKLQMNQSSKLNLSKVSYN